MTKDEIIALAVKTGLIRVGDGWTEPHRWGLAELEAFANLVTAAEREECAKLCEALAEKHGFEGAYATECATAIRARGEHMTAAHFEDHPTDPEKVILRKPSPIGLIESLKDVQPCCGEYATCWRACTPRGKFLAQRQWSSLTDDEIKEIVGPWGDTPIKGYTRWLFDKIDEALRKKNHD